MVCNRCLLIVPDAALSRALHARICTQVQAQRASVRRLPPKDLTEAVRS